MVDAQVVAAGSKASGETLFSKYFSNDNQCKIGLMSFFLARLLTATVPLVRLYAGQ